jgi:hypothetical protein
VIPWGSGRFYLSSFGEFFFFGIPPSRPFGLLLNFLRLGLPVDDQEAFATFRSSIASHKSPMTGTLEVRGLLRGGSWLDWEFWK